MSEESAITWAVCASALVIFLSVGLIAERSTHDTRLEEIQCDHKGGVLVLESGGHKACIRRDALITWHDQSEHAQ
jgi:hypothetical protein